MKDLYCIKNIGGEEGSLEGAVITLLQDNDNCMHSDKIVNGLLRIHKSVKVSEYELQQTLRKMVSQGLLTMKTVDQTESLIDELQQTNFSLCVNCGKDKGISLYSRSEGMMRNIGGFCLACKHATIPWRTSEEHTVHTVADI